ncbi:capsid protein [Enterococcus phage 9184]|uniref:Capsid protein n=1 Tax=Enterococcus phage 9184 TaxID=2763103 RepID=A0A7L8ZIM7_9CAUD|nr:capsid protein [Enterococcus phage 9184]
MNREEQLKKAHDLLSEGQFEEARSLVEAVKKQDKEELEKKASEADKEPEKEPETVEQEKVAEPEKEPEAVVEAVVEPEKVVETEPEKRSLEPKGEEINMEKVVLDGKEVSVPEEKQTEVRGFLNYLRGKQTGKLPEQRALPEDLAGMKSADGQAIIPQEIITKAKVLPETVYDLRNYVTSQKVTHAVGKYPILKSNKAKLASVEELKKNPDLENPQFTEVNYDVATYRGQLAVAQEALDDSDDDLSAIIANHIQRQGLNTANDKIAAVLRSATPKTVKNIDELKDIIDVDFDPAYQLQLLVTQSFYNAVNKMKNASGDYLLQPDVASATGKMFLGLPMTIIADDVLGTKAGDKVAFLGDPKAFAVFFDRVDTSVRWVEHMYYGQVLAVAMRFDTKAVDPAAGRFITLDTTVVPEG